MRPVAPIDPGTGWFRRQRTRLFQASAGAVVLLLALLAAPALSQTAPDLGEAFDFTVLGTNDSPTTGTVTCTTSTINGNVGSTGGFTNITCTVNGDEVLNIPDSPVVDDFDGAFSNLDTANPTCSTLNGTLAGQSPAPGVYCIDTSGKTGTLTLSGNASDVWVFKSFGEAGLAGTDFNVVMGGTADACNVYWWSEAGAAITTSNFKGTILAGADITVTGGIFDGRVLATGDVTMTDATLNFAGCAPPADITVNKDFIPDSAATVPVNLSCTSGTVDATPLDASEAAPAVFTVGAADPGATCTATETVPAGFTADETDCADVPLNGSCTIVNTQQGQITIIKNAIGGDGSFDFTGDLGPFNLTTTGGTAQTTFSDLTPGAFSVAETVPAGWTLTSASCDNGDAPGAITLGAGETVACTFTNTLLDDNTGAITILKQASPSDTGQAFDFTGDLGNFSLMHGEFIVETLPPGTYTVSETVPTGWQLDSATCDDGSPVNAIELAAGENVTCTFANSRRAALAVPIFSQGGIALIILMMMLMAAAFLRRSGLIRPGIDRR